MSRLAAQSARLDGGNYPSRFGYRTLFSDMDANRHLNNGTIGRILEEGRSDLHHSVFKRLPGSGATGRPMLLLATITIEYLREGRYPGTVEVATGVTRVGTSSFGLAQAAFQDGACVAVADCILVKTAAGRPTPLTAAERDLLEGLAFGA